MRTFSQLTFCSLILFIVSVSPLCGQQFFSDDFADGDFSNNPAWSGDTDRFVVESEQLQLRDTTPSSSNLSYLSAPALTNNQDTLLYSATVQLDFSPSASNYAQLFITSDLPDLSGNVRGYFLAIGGISGNDDALRLFRQDGDNATLLLEGTLGAVASDPVNVQVEVRRLPDGTWNLRANYGNAWIDEGSVNDTTYPTGEYTGWTCIYTSTRNEAFTLDDIRLGPLFVDTEGPVVDSVFSESDTEILVRFNEAVDASGVSTNQFSLAPSLPINAVSPVDQRTLRLTLGSPLTNDQIYTFTATAINDIRGNERPTSSTTFTARLIGFIEPGVVLLTELMVDPTPSVGQPLAEYIELHNQSDRYVQLSELTLSVNSRDEILPNFLLPPDSYVVLTDQDDLALFSISNVIGMDLPNLVDAGSVVQLSTDQEVIDLAPYDLSWYGDPGRSGNGYSLERINLNRPCLFGENWRANTTLVGGTPGTVNSVNDPDFEPDNRLHVSAVRLEEVDDGIVQLVFSERLSRANDDPFNYLLEAIDGSAPERSVIQASTETNVVTLVVDENFPPGEAYRLTFSAPLVNCSGRTQEIMDTIIIGLPRLPEPGELLINELLFNPATGGSDFVELYNTTDDLLAVSALTIGNIQPQIDTALATFSGLVGAPPNDYLVLSENPSDLIRYPSFTALKAVETDLPGFANDAGNCTLFRADSMGNIIIIDELNYTDDWHHPLLSNDDGVSLERVSLTAATDRENNWQSASEAVGFATPTRRNSQAVDPNTSNQDDAFSIPIARLSPNLDGFQDQLIVNYQLPEGEWTITARWFTANGHEAGKWLDNYAVGTSGQLFWDGTDEAGNRLPPDLYHLVLRANNLNAETRTFRKTVTLLP